MIEFVFWFCLILLSSVYLGYYFLCWLVLRTKSLKVKKKKSFRPNISIVIPTWNEEDTIEGKLKNTFALNYPKNKLEVIVIDSGSTDRTKKIIKKFKKVRLIAERTREGKSNALNKVFKYCRGDIVIISDADCRLNKDILIKTMPFFSDPTVGGLTGRQVLLNPKENITTKIEKKYRDFYYLIRGAESIIDSTFIFHGEFSAFRKELLESIFSDSVADDSELALRIRKKNYKTLFIKNAIFREYATSKLSERVKQKYRRAQGLVQIIFRFFPSFFLNPKYGLFGTLIFPVEFFMHVISPLLLIITIVALPFLPSDVLVGVSIVVIILFSIPNFRSLILTFLHSQYACLKGILTYAIKGPSLKWEKVCGTRRYKK